MIVRYVKSSGTTVQEELKGRYIAIDNGSGQTIGATITQVYKAVLEDGKVVGKLVWQLVSSCFGAGYWRDKYPWKDDNAWRDN